MGIYVVTGGHHNSALVLAEYFISHGHTIYWYGHRNSSRGDQHDSAEYQEVTAAKIPFFDLPAGRARLNIRELARIPLGFFSAIYRLSQHRPAGVITFGGYLGVATALAAYCLRVPVYLHEQTSVVGRANLLTARLAKKVFLTWESSLPFFPRGKSKVVGLPLRSEVMRARTHSYFSRRRPTLLVMGGKQGAHAINTFIFDNIHALVADFNIIHQTGSNSLTRDYEQASQIKKKLASLADCYLPLDYIPKSAIGTYLKSANYYLGRSGAHIIYELLYLHLKSILIPLTTTYKLEQVHNAQQLVKVKQGVIINQNELTLQSLHAAVHQLTKLAIVKCRVPTNATEIIYHDITNL